MKPFGSLLPVGKVPIWSTVTLQRTREELSLNRTLFELGPGYEAAVRMGWRILDRNGMCRNLWTSLKGMGLEPGGLGYTDRTHFMPFVNEEFCTVVLNMIC